MGGGDTSEDDSSQHGSPKRKLKATRGKCTKRKSPVAVHQTYTSRVDGSESVKTNYI
jgi:hypothetical protein